MSKDQVNLISNILKDLLKDGTDDKSDKIAKLIVAKLKQQQDEKAEAQSKKLDEVNNGLDANKSCSDCHRPNMYCNCPY